MNQLQVTFHLWQRNCLINSLKILDKPMYINKSMIIINSYHFHYINEDEFTYLCLSEALVPKATAFAFLEEIKELFC